MASLRHHVSLTTTRLTLTAPGTCCPIIQVLALKSQVLAYLNHALPWIQILYCRYRVIDMHSYMYVRYIWDCIANYCDEAWPWGVSVSCCYRWSLDLDLHKHERAVNVELHWRLRQSLRRRRPPSTCQRHCTLWWRAAVTNRVAGHWTLLSSLLVLLIFCTTFCMKSSSVLSRTIDQQRIIHNLSFR